MLVSYYILAYNHSKLIERAIKSALYQDYSPLEVIISDDFSTDDTWEIIQRTVQDYNGPHKVVVRRNANNLGIASHINTIWGLCNGEWIVASAGDDTSHASRVSRIMQIARRSQAVKLVQSMVNEVDENGTFISLNRLGIDVSDTPVTVFGMKERLENKSFAPHGAAMAYTRELIEFFPRLPSDVIFEDNILNLRAELLGEAAFIAEPLVNHTNHDGQITRVKARVSAKIQEERRTRRLCSDISSSKQNISDIQLAFLRGRIPQLPYRKLLSTFEKRAYYFSLKCNAISGTWPIKLINLPVLLGYASSIAPLSRDDILRAVMPYYAYRLLRGIRYL